MIGPTHLRRVQLFAIEFQSMIEQRQVMAVERAIDAHQIFFFHR